MGQSIPTTFIRGIFRTGGVSQLWNDPAGKISSLKTPAGCGRPRSRAGSSPEFLIPAHSCASRLFPADPGGFSWPAPCPHLSKKLTRLPASPGDTGTGPCHILRVSLAQGQPWREGTGTGRRSGDRKSVGAAVGTSQNTWARGIFSWVTLGDTWDKVRLVTGRVFGWVTLGDMWDSVRLVTRMVFSWVTLRDM